MKRQKYRIEVRMGTKKKIAEELGISTNFVSRALRFDSDTSPSQENIRRLAIEKYDGRLQRITTL